MSAVETNDNNFKTDVLESDKLTIVDFWAPWCGPCRKLSPVIDEIAEELGEKIKVVKLNTDENSKITVEYQVSGLPSVVIFKGGEVKDMMVGLMPKSAILSNIEKYL